MKTDSTLLVRALRRVKRFCRISYRHIQANLFLHTNIKRKAENDFIIYLSERFGDVVYALSYLSAIHLAYPNKRVIVVAHEHLQKMLESYVGIDKLVLIGPGKWLDRKNASMQNSSVSEKGLQYGIYNSNPYYYKACYTADNPGVIFQLKTHIYKLPVDSEIDFYRFRSNDAVTAIKGFNEVKEKIVVLNPYSTSAGKPAIHLYEKICEILIQKGFFVYTNVIKTQKPIQGSRELRCSIEELYAIACEIPAIISVRSGILDYLIPSGINMFVVYDNCTDRIKLMYHLTEWRYSGKICEVYPANPLVEMDQILSEFKNFLTELSKPKEGVGVI